MKDERMEDDGWVKEDTVSEHSVSEFTLNGVSFGLFLPGSSLVVLPSESISNVSMKVRLARCGYILSLR